MLGIALHADVERVGLSRCVIANILPLRALKTETAGSNGNVSIAPGSDRQYVAQLVPGHDGSATVPSSCSTRRLDVGDLPRVAVGVGEDARVAERLLDRRAGDRGAGLGGLRAERRRPSARVGDGVAEREAAPPGRRRGDAAVLGELRATPQRHDHRTGLEHDDVAVGERELPAELLVEGAGARRRRATPRVMTLTSLIHAATVAPATLAALEETDMSHRSIRGVAARLPPRPRAIFLGGDDVEYTERAPGPRPRAVGPGVLAPALRARRRRCACCPTGAWTSSTATSSDR